MPSQYSAVARRDLETVLAREIARQDAEDEIRQYLSECDAFRSKAARRRILDEVRAAK